MKTTLKQKCQEGQHPEALVRIACRELESWYLGDLQAVETGLGCPGLAHRQRRARYRDPDAIANAAEELRKLTRGCYQKMSGSRAIGRHLDPSRNHSHSFSIFVQGLTRFWETPGANPQP